MTVSKPRLKDIADALGVHPSTVSRALSPVPDRPVNEDTAARIRAEADRIGFKPNRLARGLRTRRSNTVGLVVPDIANPLMPPLLRAVEERLGKDDYTVLLVATRNDDLAERRGVEALAAHQVDGLIIASTMREKNSIKQIVSLGVPTVLALRTNDDVTLPFVVTDERRGMLQALDHLTRLGRKRIAYVSGPLIGSHLVDRLSAFESGHSAFELDKAHSQVVIRETYDIEAGRTAMLTALESQPVSAVIAGNVMMAIGCYRALETQGLQVPRDVNVIAFNDHIIAEHLTPPLTAVRNPVDAMGARAAEMLLALMAGRDAGESTALRPTLVVRSSTSHV